MRIHRSEAIGLKKIVHKSAVPIYAAAVVWVLYALLFPLYRVSHFLVAAAASAVVYGIASAFCKDVVEEVPEEPETTGNAALDEMLVDGDKALREMVRLDKNIEDTTISAQIVRLEELSSKIFAEVKRNPAKLPQIRKFMNYYLPTTLKLLNAYDRMSDQGVEGENITGTMERVRNMMSTIVTAFEKQLDSLFGDQALDISTDITVLENMMAREGLSDDPIHQTQQTDPQPAAPASSAADDTPDEAEGETFPPQGQEIDDSVTTSGGIKLEL
ncbi:MAG: 5-bromo-4-chloroindolyl phosphate hydrolysis family protein [Clostridiales bacterium]|nr:5-bromo-4-chloroindolyl phosphate hydrolysis family protein [Candidatus Cacconaster stercorequi]